MIFEKTGLVALAKMDTSKIPQSPGTKYTHYKPKCDMIIVKTNVQTTINKIYEQKEKEGKKVVIFCKQENEKLYNQKNVIVLGKTSEDASKNLFTYLRNYENNDLILSEYFDNGDMVDALFNRMIKSASGNIV